MHEKVKKYLEEQHQKELQALEDTKRKAAKDKEKTLLSLGLYDKIYSDLPEYSPEFPCVDYENGKSYKQVLINVTDEEYAEILKYSNQKPDVSFFDFKKNIIASTIKIISWLIYFSGIILLFYVDGWEDSAILMLTALLSIFISGTMILGFSEIIYLLTDIKKKKSV